jgi:hypothetical protein
MQNDFVLHDKFSKKIKDDVENLFEMGYTFISHETISSSEITQCDRRIYYKLMGESPLSFGKKGKHRSYMLDKWIDVLSRIDDFEFLEKDYTVANSECNVVSQVDIYGKLDDIPIIIMVQEVDQETFQKDKAKRNHVIDLMTQIWITQVQDGFLIYESLITKEFNVFHILPNNSVLNSIKEKLRNLWDCKILGTMPERKYETSDSKECQQCKFIDICWR